MPKGSLVGPKNSVRYDRQPSNMAVVTKIETSTFDFSSETTGPILSKLALKKPWIVLFQNCHTTSAWSSIKNGHCAKNRIFLRKKSYIHVPNYQQYLWTFYFILCLEPFQYSKGKLFYCIKRGIKI